MGDPGSHVGPWLDAQAIRIIHYGLSMADIWPLFPGLQGGDNVVDMNHIQ